jgi:hypothetical protein
MLRAETLSLVSKLIDSFALIYVIMLEIPAGIN